MKFILVIIGALAFFILCAYLSDKLNPKLRKLRLERKDENFETFKDSLPPSSLSDKELYMIYDYCHSMIGASPRKDDKIMTEFEAQTYAEVIVDVAGDCGITITKEEASKYLPVETVEDIVQVISKLK